LVFHPAGSSRCSSPKLSWPKGGSLARPRLEEGPVRNRQRRLPIRVRAPLIGLCALALPPGEGPPAGFYDGNDQVVGPSGPPARTSRAHRTAKPVELLRRPVSNRS